MYNFKKGMIPWNKGKKGLQVGGNKGKIFSFITKQKMSIAHQGIKLSKIHCLAISKGHKGINIWMKNKKLSLETKYRMSLSTSKENHPNWKGGITSENSLERIKFRKMMQKLIFERDNYKCQICETTGKLQIDHIASWAEFKELRFEPDNCRTLCAKCHYKITYGREMPDTVKSWGHNFSQLIKGGY